VFGSDEDNKPGGPGSRQWGTKAEDYEQDQSTIAKTVRAFQKGGPQAAISVLMGGAEPPGAAAKAKAAFHARKMAEALDEDALMSEMPDSQFTGPN
jgi:hypothetical protein